MDFVITAPDGKKYKVSGPNHAGAVAALKKQLGQPIGPTKEAAGLNQPFGEGTVFERPNALAQGGERDSIREIPNSPLNQVTGFLGNLVETMSPIPGGADEALAATHSLFGGNFQRELARLEQQRRDYNAVNSGQGAAATGAGIVMNPINLLGGEFISAAPSVLSRAGRAAELGGAMGATGGFLGTEGNLQDRELGGLVGTGAGASLGLAGQPLMELLGLGLKKTGEAGLYSLNAIRNQANARSDPTGQAERLAARSFLDDNVRLGYGPAPVNPPMPGQGVVNLGGENVASLGRQSTASMGPTRERAAEFFGEQASGAPDRAADALRGLSERGYYGTLETLDATRRQAAAPLYEVAYATPAVEQWTPRIAELMRRPSMRGAFERAQRIAAEEGRDPLELGLTFNEAGDPVFLAGANQNGQIPSAQTMDYIKRGLDDVIQSLPRNPATGRPIMDEGTRAIDATRRELVGILRQNPAYAAALDSWAGPSHSIEVMDLGREIFRKSGDPADSIRRFQALSPADQEYARIGFMRDAINAVGNVTDGGSVYNRIFGTSNKRALAQVMFPDEQSFNRFAAQMQAEKKMLSDNRMITGGSPTARIEADKAALTEGNNVIDWVSAAKSGNPLSILGMALDKAKNLQRGLTPEVAEALGPLLFESDPIQLQRILSRIVSVRAPAPNSTLAPGATMFLRRTPTAPLLGYGSGQAGAAIATPQGAR